MSLRAIPSPARYSCALICLLIALAACGPAPAEPTAVPATPQPAPTQPAASGAGQELRVENVGSHDIKGFSVLFPGHSLISAITPISFGDVAAGAVSAYKPAPGGVYRYGSYIYVLDGKTITQPVIDLVGESPLEGHRFTYQLRLDPTKASGSQIELVHVSVDAP